MIVVNDCSSGGVHGSRELSQTERCLKVIHHEDNRSVAAARNSAIAVARGDWLVFLDADDYFGDQYLHDVEPHLGNCKFIAASYAKCGTSRSVRSHTGCQAYTLSMSGIC